MLAPLIGHALLASSEAYAVGMHHDIDARSASCEVECIMSARACVI